MDSVTESSPGNKGGILKIKPPEEFPFPFPPYSIQTQFMEALFNTLNKGITPRVLKKWIWLDLFEIFFFFLQSSEE